MLNGLWTDYVKHLHFGVYVNQIMTYCVTGYLLFVGNDAKSPQLGELNWNGCITMVWSVLCIIEVGE